jgi:hypothetical protein
MLDQKPCRDVFELVGRQPLASLSNDSLIFIFEAGDHAGMALGMIMRINHPWRLSSASAILADSLEYRSAMVNPRLRNLCWENWITKLADFIPGEVSGISIRREDFFLRMSFLSGHILETGSEDNLPPDWSLRQESGRELFKSRAI